MGEACADRLLTKYERIRTLRRADHRARRTSDVRAQMRELAREYPGALRELDQLPLPEIERRIVELRAVVGQERPAPPWIALLSKYHGWMRAALRLRREAGAGRDPLAARRWLRTRATPPDEPSNEELLGRLEQLLRPPEGRINRVVLAAVGEGTGCSPEELERRLFPRPAKTTPSVPE